MSAVGVARLELTPESLMMMVGDTSRFVATLSDGEGNELTGRSINWTSSTPTVANVDASGRITALAAGSATIRATSEGASDEATLVIAVAPIIAVDRDTVRFTVDGGASPPPAMVLVRNDGSGSLDQLSVSTDYAAGQPAGWLDVALRETRAPTILTVAASTTTLAAGEYDATITIASPVVEQSRSITIELEVRQSPPSIALDETALRYSATEGSGDPPARRVLIRNAGGGTLGGVGVAIAYGAGQPAGWLDASVDAATAPANLTLSAKTGALAAGQYTATVLVSAERASNSPRSISVTFDVQPRPPEIDVAPAALDLSATAGGPDPSPVTVSIANSGGGQLTGLNVDVRYSGGEPSGWLSGALSTTTAPTTLTVQATTGALPTGSYTAFLDVMASTASNTPVTIAVSLDVNAVAVAPAIVLSPANLSFQATAGGGDPAGQDVDVTNSGGGTLDALALSIDYAAGQPSGWLTASLHRTTAPATIDVQPRTGSLGAGTYNATIRVASSAASNSPRTVNVTFTVAAAPVGPVIALSSTKVTFEAIERKADPPRRNVHVTNSGGGTLDDLTISIDHAAGQPTDWLRASLNKTSAPATIGVRANTAQLAVGTYHATIRVASSAASNSPQTIDVTFTVSPATDPSGMQLNLTEPASNISIWARAIPGEVPAGRR